MLKKAGIVVAAAAAGLLAVSPLAFAGGDEIHKQVNKIDDSSDNDQNGLINLLNVNDNLNNNNVNVCPNVQVDVLRVLSNNAVGVLGGEGEADNSQTTNCTGESGNNQKNKNNG